MWKLIDWFNGGYNEEEVFSCETFEEMAEYIKTHGVFLGSDNYGEDGTDLRDPDGELVESLRCVYNEDYSDYHYVLS